ncbi:PAS domain-containing sensor histidine kinase [Actinoplanes sp. NPDC023714]|uniref:PAS domain-containing sensor histidine kinase n=1 Tax=Actinoplanes sp. NPDC023714 TaxID=3154322 RepID=UPI0033C22E89
MGRLSRLIAGCAGAMVAVFGFLDARTLDDVVPPEGPLPTPAVALLPAGVALLVQVAPAAGDLAARVRTGFAALFALAAAGLAVTRLGDQPAASAATLLSGLALACLDVRLPRHDGSATRIAVPSLRQDDATSFRLAEPLLLGAAVIALVALLTRLLDPALLPAGGPDAVMPSDQALASLLLTAGAILARPASQDPVLRSENPFPGTASAAPTPESAPAAGPEAEARAPDGPPGTEPGSMPGGTPGTEPVSPPGEAPDSDREDFAHALLQSMNEAVMVLDANYHVIDVNRRWRELTGLPDDDVARDPPPLPPPGTGGGDWTIPRADGTAVPVLATMAAIPDAAGATRGYVATCVDIAERKHAEDALSEHAAELERGNAQLAAALAFKNDLTSMLTHDVAQPISSIASLAELLCADWADLPDDIRLELATKIDKNTRRLVRMMNDLQLLFRLDTGAVTARRVPVPLLEVVRTVRDALTGDGDGGVEIAIDEDLTALADRGHFTVVVENLLKNALAHGSPPILVRADRQDGSVLLVVQDSGPGIPENVLPSVFNRIVKGAGIKGAGLGLFIVRHLIEANGGSVRYEPVSPRGARLLVTMERAPA